LVPPEPGFDEVALLAEQATKVMHRNIATNGSRIAVTSGGHYTRLSPQYLGEDLAPGICNGQPR
jgi:hypothetical protein